MVVYLPIIQAPASDLDNLSTVIQRVLHVVSILLCFTRAQRDGLWDLHLYAFKRMLPFFFRYDHINYSKWGSVYLAEMSDLPQEVLYEFQEGNFIV